MSKAIVPIQRIAQKILSLRGERVLLDRDLALLYGVETKTLNQAVKRNAARFPEDFMFKLSGEEIARISQIVTSSHGGGRSRSQIVTLKRGQNIKFRPYAFTEQGVAMLSSVLKSDRAVKVNIAIMRAFVRLRQALETNRELARKFAELKKRVGKHDDEIAAIIDTIRQLMAPPEKPRREIGFHVREKTARYRAGNHR
jgi:hypothetical protein